jgi:hypothetical protein
MADDVTRSEKLASREAGLHNLTDREYQDLDAVSQSDLLRWVSESKGLSPRKLAMRSALHMAWLEPERFKQVYHVVEEDFEIRGNAGQARLEELSRQHGGKTIIRHAESIDLRGLLVALLDDRVAQAVRNGPGEHEQVAVARLVEGVDVLSKGRLDVLTAKAVWDLKTTYCASAEEFLAESVPHFRYDVQAAYYRDLAASCSGLGADNPRPFAWLCVSTKNRAVFAVRCPEEVYRGGRSHYQSLIRLYDRYRHGGSVRRALEASLDRAEGKGVPRGDRRGKGEFRRAGDFDGDGSGAAPRRPTGSLPRWYEDANNTPGGVFGYAPTGDE